MMDGEPGTRQVATGINDTDLKIVDEISLGVSSSESLITTRARLFEGDGDLGWYVIKKFREPDRVERHMAAYGLLKDNGFPVPADVRQIASRPDSLAATDLTENGRLSLYSCNVSGGETEWKSRPRIGNMEEVGQQLLGIARVADGLGIFITYDSFFFVYDEETMEGKIVIGDLGGVMTRGEAVEFGYGPEDSVESIVRTRYYPVLVGHFNGGELFPDTRIEDNVEVSA